MSFAFILILFLGFRIIDWLISYLAPFFIPYLGFFPLKEFVVEYKLPKFLSAFANFDGGHYLVIAKSGYFHFQQAFFPLYPLLIRWLSPFFLNNHLLTALLISNISFFLGLFVFSKYLKLISTSFIKFQPVPTILFLLFFPTSFFFGAVYTEGLFFFLLVGFLYFLIKKDRLLTFIFGFLAALTRLIGLFLFIPIFLSFVHSNDTVHWSKKLLLLLSPIMGVLLYSLFLFKTTGDPFFFLNAQWAFGAHRTSSIILLPQVYFRYLKIFFTAAWNFQYFISLFEFITFNFVFIILILDLFKNLNLKFVSSFEFRISNLNYDRIGLSLFSLINLLIPTFTGTFSSIPRYALFSLSFFVYLSQIKSSSIKLAIAVIFVILHVLVLGFFIQGYFVS